MNLNLKEVHLKKNLHNPGYRYASLGLLADRKEGRRRGGGKIKYPQCRRGAAADEWGCSDAASMGKWGGEMGGAGPWGSLRNGFYWKIICVTRCDRLRTNFIRLISLSLVLPLGRVGSNIDVEIENEVAKVHFRHDFPNHKCEATPKISPMSTYS